MNPANFETQPRWPGAPLICIAENRPAFPTKEDALAFHEKVSPGNHIVRIGKCPKCDYWHYTFKPRAPSGDSSGISSRHVVI